MPSTEVRKVLENCWVTIGAVSNEEHKLKNLGMKIITIRSVSNLRSGRIKGLLPLEILLWLERHLQVPLAKIHFGPSMFILAKKI